MSTYTAFRAVAGGDGAAAAADVDTAEKKHEHSYTVILCIAACHSWRSGAIGVRFAPRVHERRYSCQYSTTHNTYAA